MGKRALFTGVKLGSVLFEVAKLIGASDEYDQVVVTLEDNKECIEVIEALRIACAGVNESFYSKKVKGVAIDLTNQTSIENFVDKLHSIGLKFDVVYLGSDKTSESDDVVYINGVEETFMHGVISPHLLVTHLLNKKRLSKKAKIIAVGSDVSKGDSPTSIKPLNLDKLLKRFKHDVGAIEHILTGVIKGDQNIFLYKPGVAFSTSKALLNLWVAALSVRLKLLYPEMMIVCIAPGAYHSIQAASLRLLNGLRMQVNQSGEFFSSAPSKTNGQLVKNACDVFNKSYAPGLREATWKGIISITEVQPQGAAEQITPRERISPSPMPSAFDKKPSFFFKFNNVASPKIS